MPREAGGGEVKTFVSTDNQNQETHVWLTPLNLINSLGDFDLDPCAFKDHFTAKKLIYPPDDGLKMLWYGRVWLNPPYGNYAKDLLKKLNEHGNGIALCFSRLETSWLRPYLKNGFFVLNKRITFQSPISNKKGNAGTGSILIPFGRQNIGSILQSDLEGEYYK